MRKLALCLFYALCTFTIAFSLFWMALPRLNALSPAPQGEADSVPLSLAACGADGQPADRLEETGIYVNLLPENDALRIKQGLSVYSETELRTVLEDLGE